MDPKALKALLKVMRENGVLHLKTADVELQLAPEALFPRKGSEDKNIIEEVGDKWENFPPGELSPEQLMYYSSGGSPEQDPYREDN